MATIEPSKLTGLPFEQALLCLKQGYKLRRPHFPAHRYLIRSIDAPGEIILKDRAGDAAITELRDLPILLDDWEAFL